MFPAQTSLIPASVALVKWIEANGFGGLYPYWYLGSTPVKYLIGPVVPGILIGLHKILPNLSLFELSIFSLITFHLSLSIGWGLLAWQLSSRRKIGVLVGIISIFAPWHWVSGFGLTELSADVASSLTPWVLFSFARGLGNVADPAGRSPRPTSSLQSNLEIENNMILDAAGARLGAPAPVTRNISEVFTSTTRQFRSMVNGQLSIVPVAGAFAFLLLTNAVSAIPTVAGLVILGIVLSKRWEEGLKRVGVVIFGGWLIATLWYGPGYWLTIWGAPSLGGRSAVLALGWVIDMFRGLVPFLLAVGVVLVGIRPKDVYSKFAFSWFFVFAVLTLIRFMADPDFWMDWTAWMGEVEVGLALVAASKFAKIKHISDLSHLRNLSNLGNFWNLVIGILIIIGWFWAYQSRDFWLPRKSIENTVEFRIANWLSNNLTIKQSNNHSLVFLSGTTAFWLNSLVDIRQVRGGADHASVDSNWREAAWVIRQGESSAEIVKWTGKLNIDYIVVHTEQSKEFYHDFENPGVFDGISTLSKIYDDQGDLIYVLND